MRFMYVVTALFFACFIVVQYLSNSGAFGKTNADVSRLYPTPVTPANWAFSIWGLIFLGQLLACVYVFVPSRTENSTFWKARAASVTFHWWIVGWVCECMWQVFFARASASSMLLASPFIVGALVAFQKALSNLHGLQNSTLPALPTTVYSVFWVPTAVNAAWLSIAASVQLVITIMANTHIPAIPTGAALAFAALVGGTTLTYIHKDAPYGLTLIWSFVAVYGGRQARDTTVQVLCIVALLVLLPVTLSTVLRKRSMQPSRTPYGTTPMGSSPNMASPRGSDEAPLLT